MLYLICSIGYTIISPYNIIDAIANTVVLQRAFLFIFKRKKCEEEELINNNIRSDLPSTNVVYNSIKVHKTSLLKHIINGTIYSKSLDKMKRAAGFSCYKNVNITAVARATMSIFIEEENIYLSEERQFCLLVNTKIV